MRLGGFFSHNAPQLCGVPVVTGANLDAATQRVKVTIRTSAARREWFGRVAADAGMSYDAFLSAALALGASVLADAVGSVPFDGTERALVWPADDDRIDRYG